MNKKVNLLNEQAHVILTLCNADIEKKGPNYDILNIIKKEFAEITECIEREGKIKVLNKRKQLLSSKIIIDSADFNFNKELFFKIEKFSRKCARLPKKYCVFEFDY